MEKGKSFYTVVVIDYEVEIKKMKVTEKNNGFIITEDNNSPPLIKIYDIDSMDSSPFNIVSDTKEEALAKFITRMKLSTDRMRKSL